MPIWLLEWFDQIGIRIFEAYGISENIIPIACNTQSHFRIGTVGKALSPNEVRLSTENEVEVKGPGIFSHYLQRSEDCRNVSADGFLKTGDEGSIDKDGFISLQGRKADFFKI